MFTAPNPFVTQLFLYYQFSIYQEIKAECLVEETVKTQYRCVVCVDFQAWKSIIFAQVSTQNPLFCCYLAQTHRTKELANCAAYNWY